MLNETGLNTKKTRGDKMYTTKSEFIKYDDGQILLDYKNAGFVYIFHAEGSNRYKLGRSRDPEKRINQIQDKQQPFPLKLVQSGWFFDAKEAERFYHEILSDRRVYGEWFIFNDPTELPNLLEFDGLDDDYFTFKNQKNLTPQTLKFIEVVAEYVNDSVSDYFSEDVTKIQLNRLKDRHYCASNYVDGRLFIWQLYLNIKINASLTGLNPHKDSVLSSSVYDSYENLISVFESNFRKTPNIQEPLEHFWVGFALSNYMIIGELNPDYIPFFFPNSFANTVLYYIQKYQFYGDDKKLLKDKVSNIIWGISTSNN